MIVKCLECSAFHQINTWIYLGKEDNQMQIYEIHITCLCGNKLTIEREKNEKSQKNKFNTSLMIGCEHANPRIIPNFVHSEKNILEQYYNGLRYDSWGQMGFVEAY